MMTATAEAAALDRARSTAINLLCAFAVACVMFTPVSGLAGDLTVDPNATATSAPVVRLDTNLAPAPPFHLTASPAEAARAVRCLTDAIYYEAANEPQQGQRAIAQVVLNRVRDPHFPKSVCGVVYEGWQRRTGCQFSFVCDGSIRRRHADQAVWDQLKPLAEDALNGRVVPEVGSATHYYADYIRPYWLTTVDQVTQIGAHVFCSWRGRAGFVSELTETYAGGESEISDAVLDGDALRSAPTKGAGHRRGRRVAGRLRFASNGRDDAGV
jgi:hypothetical protein